MSEQISMKAVERRVFRTAFQDGLWDIFIGCVVLMFAVAPFLSRAGLGDFWSSAVFVPFWGLLSLVLYIVRRRVVTPRIGVVKFGWPRRRRLLWFTVGMLVLSSVSLVLALLAARNLDAPWWVHTLRFGLVMLGGFVLTGFFLDFTRLYLYGVLLALAPLLGEWLYRQLGVPHHGYPITFGAATGIILAIGLIKLVRLLRRYPAPTEGLFPEGV